MKSSKEKSKKRIFLTGATGTLGYNILRHLVGAKRYHITASVRQMHPRLDEFAGAVDFVRHELSDAIHTAQLFERANPAVILHCAASGLRPPRASWFDLMRFNVESTMQLFQMNCRFDHHSRFVYVSTGLVYRNQDRPLRENDPIETLHSYGASKAAGDAMLQAAAAEFGRSLTILRPFAFTGKHDGEGRLFPSIIKSAAQCKVMPMTLGTQIRDYCSVDDIARAVLLVVDREPTELIERFNLGGGQWLPLRTLVESVCREIGLSMEFDFGAVKTNPYEPKHLVSDNSLAEQLLGWRPRSRLSYAVWELAQELAPQLSLIKPEQFYGLDASL
jgi:nucleoside-diphosphate-sugar epimerase